MWRLLLLVAASLILVGCSDSATPALLKEAQTTTSTTLNPATAANEVESCMRTHNMTYANQVNHNYTSEIPPFLQGNPNPFSTSDIEYSSQSPTVTLFQSCAWPPPSWADQTGYGQILMTSAPGDTSWPGEISPYADAYVIDATCHTVQALLSGEHTGTSFSNNVTVSRGQLVVAGGDGTGFGLPPGAVNGEPSLAGWGRLLAFEIQPGESVILHLDPESVTSANCTN